MKFFDPSFDNTAYPEVRNSQLSSSDTGTPVLTAYQKFMVVLVAVLSSFAVGSIPVIYAFTLAPSQSNAATQTPIIRGEMF